MKFAYLVIRDNGDHSQTIEWHRTMSKEKKERLAEDESYQSGDGVQITALKFPGNFDIEGFTKLNHIFWQEDDLDE